MATATPESECPTCGKPYATDEDGDMKTTDPRVPTLCWARPERGDECDGAGEIARKAATCEHCGLSPALCLCDDERMTGYDDEGTR